MIRRVGCHASECISRREANLVDATDPVFMEFEYCELYRMGLMINDDDEGENRKKEWKEQEIENVPYSWIKDISSVPNLLTGPFLVAVTP